MPHRHAHPDRPPHRAAIGARVCAAAALALATTGAAHAQHALGGPLRGPTQPTRVDQGYADIDALSSSLLNLDAQRLMRDPVGFHDLYAGDDGLLYRFDGALGVSFPHSLYIPTRDGEITAVPAGAVYHIGVRPEDIAGRGVAPARPGAAPYAVDARAGLHAPVGAAGTMLNDRASTQRKPVVAQSTSDDPGHVVTDEAYRKSRVAELLRGGAARGAGSTRR